MAFSNFGMVEADPSTSSGEPGSGQAPDAQVASLALRDDIVLRVGANLMATAHGRFAIGAHKVMRMALRLVTPS